RFVAVGIRRRLENTPACGWVHSGERASSGPRRQATPACRNEKAAGGVVTAKQAPRRPGTAPAPGLRAEVGRPILPQTAPEGALPDAAPPRSAPPGPPGPPPPAGHLPAVPRTAGRPLSAVGLHADQSGRRPTGRGSRPRPRAGGRLGAGPQRNAHGDLLGLLPP